MCKYAKFPIWLLTNLFHCRPDAEWQDYHPETKEDPNKPKPKDPNAADIPDYEAGIKGVRENPSPDSSADG